MVAVGRKSASSWRRSFRYQATVSSFAEAETGSRSTSAATTEIAPSAAVETVWTVQPPPAPAFSHQAISSS
jgi:hypothetical protein